MTKSPFYLENFSVTVPLKVSSDGKGKGSLWLGIGGLSVLGHLA